MSKSLIKNGKVYINSSIIKAMTFKGEKRLHCPRKIYAGYVAKTAKSEPSIYMLRGLFFEYRTLGAMSSQQQDEVDFTRLYKKRDVTSPMAETERLMQQINRFNDEVVPAYGLIVDEERVQVKGEKAIDGTDIMLTCESDLISPISFTSDEGKEYVFDEAIIDIKTTADLHSEYSEYSWGNAKEMDHIQAYINGYIWELPFLYLVFDYKKYPEYKPFLKEMDKAQSAEYFRTIMYVRDMVMEYEETHWPAIPAYNICATCKLQDVCDKFINKPTATII